MRKDLFSIKGKVVIITGAGRGIGREIAVAMAERDSFVYCIDISFSNKVPKQLSDHLFEKMCNITNQDEFEIICHDIFDRHQKIDVLVNNAGVTYTKQPDEPYPLDHWERTP